jgi:lipopolysaccharide/colanic/teichoic acid biosynthesis glycosyltransferase
MDSYGMKKRLQSDGIKYLDSTGQQGVFDEKTFRFVLRRERARSNRTGRPFSLVVFDLPKKRSNSSDLWLLNVLARHIRITDMIGWVDAVSPGVLLPETDAIGTGDFMNKITPILSDAGTVPGIHVYTYPEEKDDGKSRTDTGISAPFVSNHASDSARFVAEMLAVAPPLPVRVVERAAAGVALVVLSPLFLLIAVIIRIGSTGPILFRQERVGQGGQTFYCYKFRTMLPHAETQSHEDYFSYLMSNAVPMKKLDGDGDPRIFPFGRFLRAASLDELPQLINIFKGEMRLVGPRPCTPREFEQYLLWQRERVDVTPGLTGLWQVSGKNKTTFEQMMRLDLRYAAGRSVLMDLWIILKTVPVTLGLYIEDRRERKAS